MFNSISSRIKNLIPSPCARRNRASTDDSGSSEPDAERPLLSSSRIENLIPSTCARRNRASTGDSGSSEPNTERPPLSIPSTSRPVRIESYERVSRLNRLLSDEELIREIKSLMKNEVTDEEIAYSLSNEILRGLLVSFFYRPTNDHPANSLPKEAQQALVKSILTGPKGDNLIEVHFQ